MKTEHIHLKRSYKLSIQLDIFDENNIFSDIHFSRVFIWVTGLNEEGNKEGRWFTSFFICS